MRSPTFSPSPTTTSVVPSGPVAAVQLPLPSLAVHVISPAMAKVETRHSAARSPPSVFPKVCRIGCPFLLQRVRRFACYALPGALTACSCQPGARLRSPVMRANCIPPTPPTLRHPHTDKGYCPFMTSGAQVATESGRTPVVVRRQSGLVEDVATDGHVTPCSAGSLIGTMGMRPKAQRRRWEPFLYLFSQKESHLYLKMRLQERNDHRPRARTSRGYPRKKETPRSGVPPPASQPWAGRQDATGGPGSPVAHLLLIPLPGFLCSTVLGPRRYGDGTTQTLLLPRRHDPGEPAAPAGAQHGLGGHEDARADARDGPPGRWGHLSRATDVAGVAARCSRPPRRDRCPVGDGHARCGPRHHDSGAPVYHPRRVAGSTGDLQDARGGSGAAHRGTARAGAHAGARGPGSPGRAAGGAPVTAGALYGRAPPGQRGPLGQVGRLGGAHPGERRAGGGGV